MKRSHMIALLTKFVYDATDGNTTLSSDESKLVLNFLEKAGMKPPVVDEMMRQSIMHVYYGHSMNVWDEDFHNDPRLVDALNKRIEYYKLTPEERKVKVRELREKVRGSK